ncbi:ADP-heptose--LPS heptosyltransferase II [Halomonas urumqiensis]|nr:ADP-heptose--LPS heptosyltransferase II [Halomonas urumqiensis]
MAPRESSPHLLVVRNDKLGDFMLAWPALARLKSASPTPRVSVLVPAYTAPMAHLCPWVDDVIIDPGEDAGREAHRELLRTLKRQGFDALLTLFSTPRIGWLGWRAGIPMRLAPATKWAQIFYNARIRQRRSRSERPEYVYNIELADKLVEALGLVAGEPVTPPFWPLDDAVRKRERARIAAELGLQEARPWCFLHGGSGGSAVNLSAQRYVELIRGIERHLDADSPSPHWILTAGPGEEAVAETIREPLELAGISAHRLPPRQGLDDFALSLAAADLFIAGSTGPLHIAGCLDLATAGFYPSRRSATPLRWQTCNTDDHRLAFCPPIEAAEQDMASIDLAAASEAISALLRRLVAEQASES